jgi:hypothetical protein
MIAPDTDDGPTRGVELTSARLYLGNRLFDVEWVACDITGISYLLFTKRFAVVSGVVVGA